MWSLGRFARRRRQRRHAARAASPRVVHTPESLCERVSSLCPPSALPLTRLRRVHFVLAAWVRATLERGVAIASRSYRACRARLSCAVRASCRGRSSNRARVCRARRARVLPERARRRRHVRGACDVRVLQVSRRVGRFFVSRAGSHSCRVRSPSLLLLPLSRYVGRPVGACLGGSGGGLTSTLATLPTDLARPRPAPLPPPPIALPSRLVQVRQVPAPSEVGKVAVSQLVPLPISPPYI